MIALVITPWRFVVDVMRVEVADQAGTDDQMRLGDRHAATEALADLDVIEPFALHVHAGGPSQRFAPD